MAAPIGLMGDGQWESVLGVNGQACALRLLRSREAPSWSNGSLRELLRGW